jgi:2-dehydropantoate 2-reductase
MRILVVGAGAVGGYFGGRLLQAGRDVTFLVRPARAASLAEHGLRIRSPHGDFSLPNPPTVLAGNLRDPFDVILLSCKAYDLDGAIASFAPAVGPQTAVLPLLNGMRHLDVLDGHFGAGRVLGGQCQIAADVNATGEIVQLSEMHALTFGERDGDVTARIQAIEGAITGAGFNARSSKEILQEMWEKWVFLATLAGGTCLMRSTIGDIVEAPGGLAFMRNLFAECAAIAAANGFPVREAFTARALGIVTTAGLRLTASMFRDMERNAPTEADHVLGDLLRRRGEAAGVTALDAAYTHLKTYEARRVRVTA